MGTTLQLLVVCWPLITAALSCAMHWLKLSDSHAAKALRASGFDLPAFLAAMRDLCASVGPALQSRGGKLKAIGAAFLMLGGLLGYIVSNAPPVFDPCTDPAACAIDAADADGFDAGPIDEADDDACDGGEQ